MDDFVKEIDLLVEESQKALKTLVTFDQEKVDSIVKALSGAGLENAEKLAKAAFDETGMGVYEHKIQKNQAAAGAVYDFMKDKKSVGIIGEENGVYEVAEPYGVVAAAVPVTHPTATTIFKSLIALKGRNAIIFAFHPRAQKSSAAAAQIMLDAALAAGAPKGCIQWIDNPSIEKTNYLMKHRNVSLIVATGGGALVKAAYSSGHPCLGVGPGNVPVYVEKTANLPMMVNCTIASKTWDNSTPCSSESVLIFDDALVAESAKKLFIDKGAYFCSSQEKSQLINVMFDKEKGVVAAQAVAQSPHKIAELAGMTIPNETKILIVPIDSIGPTDYMSHEKLSPVLAWYQTANKDEAIKAAIDVLEFGGAGHTAAIYSKNDEILREFGVAVPANRVVFNQPSGPGSIGAYNPQIAPTFTLGCGSRGGNSVSENVTYRHLLNIKKLVKRIPPESIDE